MTTLMTDTDRYEELAAASRRVIGSWDKPGQLAPAVNELRETLEAHGHADHDEDCITLCEVDVRDKCRAFHGCWCSEHSEVGAHPE